MKNSAQASTERSRSGFTLVELLVVIAIIAILTVIGVVLFSGVQNKARDSKRIQDIVAMSKAMEVNYVAGTGYQTTVSSTWFSDNAIPTNPGPGGTPYATNTITTSSFTFCAMLENSTGNATSSTGSGMGASTGSYFCKKNAQ